mmetsp:Transcript_41190/g.96606  ORF Transcript_41190/g.96606 Transcript_41190/m.96606 type:complete len:114 (-) Transcript_41190:387-728(-)|eukprot:CAMPEP_0113324596 /NCGR_PEP_ID=MMETSP0010_2-20120614/17142_1 /TAXON_ID=216773 ORGANISM="Corethron hystrix, Strain 308" /NCGR_SAMPLE_ID=MMETSP0010_2 /ASSEMBLY_ACC=CAM_ASM_000155 /LENGTH=113 /DNA_ID=CAMNT_0000184011 /DNA_START=39 /DNA_END=380 /DNA_ORIENTATION=- /assembly_acc=CAM_ASM_000155
MTAVTFNEEVQMCDTSKDNHTSSIDTDGDDNSNGTEKTPLPMGWVESKDAYSGVYFYMNSEKGLTTWKRPDPESAVVGTIPTVGWTEMTDAFSGKPYYIKDGITTWIRPTAEN